MFAVEKKFRAAREPQPQCKPEVRAHCATMFNKLCDELKKAPLTGVLAGVKSVTRS
jgi:hypothetical protein